MGILVNKDTRVIVQGITGKQAAFHTKQMLAYGTKIVAGVTPGKAGQEVEGVPVFNTVKDAVDATGATASVVYVPARFAADSIMEGVDAGLDLVVCITEHIPVLDMVKVRRYMDGKKTRLIGPNCPGIMTTGECKLGIIPGNIQKRGHVGLVSRSGTLTYEAAFQLMNAGIGITTSLGIGGDFILKNNIFLQTHGSFFTNYYLWDGERAQPAEVENRTATALSLMLDIDGGYRFKIGKTKKHLVSVGGGIGFLARYAFLSGDVDSSEVNRVTGSTAGDDVSDINSNFYAHSTALGKLRYRHC